MTNKKNNPVTQLQHSVDFTTRQWTDEEIRAAQLRIANEAITKKNPTQWLRETLDMLGLLPTDKNRIGRWRVNASPTMLNMPLTADTDIVMTDLERNTERVVDTKGHGTVAGYQMHIKRYERPCEHCAIANELDQERILSNQGVNISDNHTVGYQ